ncbi:MAG: hypothetical protein IT374_01300 [Polyangiaceae bacterium]|nr:hypothetical protein [Polyangiaceae bacterium]
MHKRAIVCLTLGLSGLALGLVGCSKDSPAPTPAPAATSAALPAASTAAPAASSAAPAASSAAPASSAAAGAAHLHVDTVKTVKGKIDGAEKRVKSRAMNLKNKCAKDVAADGKIVFTLDLDKEGKIKKQAHKVEGKVPDDVVKCMEGWMKEKLEFDTNDAEAKLEITLSLGPEVKDK